MTIALARAKRQLILKEMRHLLQAAHGIVEGLRDPDQNQREIGLKKLLVRITWQ